MLLADDDEKQHDADGRERNSMSISLCASFIAEGDRETRAMLFSVVNSRAHAAALFDFRRRSRRGRRGKFDRF